MQIGIIGLGLIGGSIAKDLMHQLSVTVIGSDKNPAHREKAKELGLVHEVMEESRLITLSDVIICAIPVHTLEKKIYALLDQIHSNQILIDTGSTKAHLCKHVANHPHRGRFVASHPLAGTENSGPESAVSGLFAGKKNIICDHEKSDPDAVEITKRIFKSIGMDSYMLHSAEHDKHLAYVSHLSHVSSFMLGLTVLDLEKDEHQIAQLASTGFASTVRLAKSSPETWSAIFDKNHQFVAEALEEYIAYLSSFLSYIKANDKKNTERLMREANQVRRILDGLQND